MIQVMGQTIPEKFKTCKSGTMEVENENERIQMNADNAKTQMFFSTRSCLCQSSCSVLSHETKIQLICDL